MRIKPPQITYPELERRALLDLATATNHDPDAHPDHVKAARKVLAHASDGSPDELARDVVQRLPLDLVGQLHDWFQRVSAYEAELAKLPPGDRVNSFGRPRMAAAVFAAVAAQRASATPPSREPDQADQADQADVVAE